MAKSEYETICAEILEAVGGSQNIKTVFHCITRLRIVPVNRDLVNMEKLNQINGLLKVIESSGQIQCVIGTTVPEKKPNLITQGLMLMCGKEASNRKQEIDRQHHTIPNQRNQRPKDKHRGNVYNLLFRHGKVRSQNMEKLKYSFPTFCKRTFPQLHKTASYAHYAQCRLLRNPPHSYLFLQFVLYLFLTKRHE